MSSTQARVLVTSISDGSSNKMSSIRALCLETFEQCAHGIPIPFGRSGD